MASTGARQLRQRLAERLLEGRVGLRLHDGTDDLLYRRARVAQVDERRQQVGADARRLGGLSALARRGDGCRQTVAQFEHDALGGLASDARHRHQPRDVLRLDATMELVGGHSGEDGQRDARPDA